MSSKLPTFCFPRDSADLKSGKVARDNSIPSKHAIESSRESQFLSGMNQRKQDTRSSSSSDSHRYRRPWRWRGLGDCSDSSDLSGGNCGHRSSTGAAGSWTFSHRYLRFPLLPIGSRWLICRKKTGYPLKTKIQEVVFGCENPLDFQDLEHRLFQKFKT